MKTIGLIGGMSWESSLEYYRIINETVKDRLGGLHSARCLMYSVDFAEIEVLRQQGEWQDIARVLIKAAKNLESAGAECISICTNTMHKLADDVEANIAIPLLHIADVTAYRIKARGFSKIGLLGTRITMEEDFYKGRLLQKHGLSVVIPEEKEREIIHRVIYDELVLGEIRPESREQYVRIMEQLVRAGAEGIILGCTEIGLLIHDDDSRVPLFDTTRIHAIASAEYALGQDQEVNAYV